MGLGTCSSDSVVVIIANVAGVIAVNPVYSRCRYFGKRATLPERVLYGLTGRGVLYFLRRRVRVLLGRTGGVGCCGTAEVYSFVSVTVSGSDVEKGTSSFQGSCGADESGVGESVVPAVGGSGCLGRCLSLAVSAELVWEIDASPSPSDSESDSSQRYLLCLSST